MRIVALLSFYDEYPAWLTGVVASLAGVADHVVAVDGAYLLYAGGGGSSGPTQHAALVDGAAAARIGFTLHVPGGQWAGGEVQKRAFMFDAGRLALAGAADWFLVLDADELILSAPPDLHERLAATDCDVAAYGLATPRDEHPDAARFGMVPMPTADVHPMRGLYRNLPGLTVRGTHYGYVSDEHSDLWAGAGALDLTDLRVEHRGHRRAQARRFRQQSYYLNRDQAGIEREVTHA